MWRSASSPPPAALLPRGRDAAGPDSPPTPQFIQPPGSLPSEVLHLALPASCRPWLPALAWYLRQNLLIFLHSPKYTDSNSRNHFQVRVPQCPRPLTCSPTSAFTSGPLPSPRLYLVPVSSGILGYLLPAHTHQNKARRCVMCLVSVRSFSPQHPLPPQGGLPDLDIYLYNKPGGQGTGGKGIVSHGWGSCGHRDGGRWRPGPESSCECPSGVACITLAFVDERGAPISLTPWTSPPLGSPDSLQEEDFEQLTQVTRCPLGADSSPGGSEVGLLCEGRGGEGPLLVTALPFFPPAQSGVPRLRLDVWEKGNISVVQLEEKLRGAARQALADAILELQLLPAPLCTEDTPPGNTAQAAPWPLRVPGVFGDTGQREVPGPSCVVDSAVTPCTWAQAAGYLAVPHTLLPGQLRQAGHSHTLPGAVLKSTGAGIRSVHSPQEVCGVGPWKTRAQHVGPAPSPPAPAPESL